MTLKNTMVLCHLPGVIESVLGLVGPSSLYYASDLKIDTRWLPSQTSDVRGSVLGFVGPASVLPRLGELGNVIC